MGLGAVQGASATAAKNGELVTGFIHGPVAVNAFGNSERGAAHASSGNKFWNGPWAEAGEVRWVIPG